jgi:hypothetical protein
VLINGFYQQVATLKETTTDWASLKNMIPMPTGWKDSSAVEATVYYSVSATDGDVYMTLAAEAYSVGDELAVPRSRPPNTLCEAPDETGVIYSFTHALSTAMDAGSGIDLLEFNVMRYMISGGSSVCEDSNTGDVYIHGVKIELIP